MSEESPCPCGSGKSAAECCLPYVRGEKPAPTAEALMRSRYTAYTLAEVDYIVATHHADGRDEVDRDGAKTWATESEWVGLEINDTEAGGESDETGVVEFVARYRAGGGEHAHHERSRFRRVDGKWYYVDGDMVRAKPVRRDEAKVGRNEPCVCGSGKKFKKCCGKN